MSTRSEAAIRVWRARSARTAGDRGYLVYMFFMVALLVAAPVARAVWLSASSMEGAALFASPAAPAVTALVVACVWAGALLLGRERGPALRPPFLTHALATIDLPRSDTFAGPVLRAGAMVTASTTIAAAVVASSLVSRGLAEPLHALAFTAVGAAVGIITTAFWLIGQAFSRAAIPLALGSLALGAATATFPSTRPFSPWGGVALAYPGVGSMSAAATVCALAIALAASLPTVMNRLSHAELAAQAARWDSVTIHAAGMDFSTAAAIYQGRPHRGRRLRAVRPMNRLSVTFFIRDAVGATRTPGRLIAGILALIGAGALIVLAFAPTAPSLLLGAGAGVLLFTGLGPLTDGLRHAAYVASDLPLYGISDAHLLTNHLLFPVTMTAIVLVATVLVCAATTGIAVIPPLLSALTLGLLTLVARVSNALKGPLQPALLAPIPTPMGDLGAAIRLIWALDALLVAAMAGVSATLILHTPVLLVGIASAMLAVAVHRWHRRG
ncbi:hypothetical protein GCM10025760_33120 [Microbacterium yannicii]|uniref:ABC transporter permease n=1 Tax=Microbacterium yannicii TaxID=671622 RepID=A0ABP9MKV3_9MICO|nr:hypothetical protein [Microbacterium yannicii]MCO5951785.1 hypothetical protein [Microbacterium yannicii]